MDVKRDNGIMEDFNWKKFILINFLLWIAISLLVAFKYNVYELSVGKEIHWAHVIFYNLNSGILWAVITPFVLIYSNRLFQSKRKWHAHLLIHCAFALFIVPLQTYAFLWFDFGVQNKLELWTKSMTFSQYFSSYFLELLVQGFITFLILVSLLLGYILYLKNKKVSALKLQLEDNFNKSRILNLKYQLQPHFLFNGMQTISNLMHINVNVADEAIANLSDILRFSINQLNNDLISISEEVEIVEKFLSFQKLRFKDQISSSISIQENLETEKIPALLLQPIVENSIKHGFETSGKSIKMDIEIFEEKNRIVLMVKDNGPGFVEDFETKPNTTGLKNLKHRLHYFYKDDFEFNIVNLKIGAKTVIKVPKKINNDRI